MTNSPDNDTVADGAIVLTHDHRGLTRGLPAKIRHIANARFIDMRARIKRARRFDIEDDMLRAVVQASAVDPDVIRKRLMLASLPFDTTWIEFSSRVRVEEQFRLGTSGPPDPELYKMGFLLERGAAEQPAWVSTSFIQTLPDKRVSPAIIQHGFRLPLPPQMDKVQNKEGPYELGRKAWGWTTGPHPQASYCIPEDFERLVWTVPTLLWHSTAWTVNEDRTKLWVDQVIDAANEARGDIRFLVTLLAVINHTPIEYREVANRGSRQVRLRNVPFLDHSVVKIHAGKKNVIYLIDRSLKKAYHAHARHRAHEVRGHHRVLHKGTVEERTIWIKEHVRGDASLGWVRQEWRVELTDAKEMLP